MRADVISRVRRRALPSLPRSPSPSPSPWPSGGPALGLRAIVVSSAVVYFQT
ncbi:uncharacterized protein MYCFIDRAFT_181915 [Pseudocercospora fijiensis CIRAD86]|uniref:Uncharacterized protein n=1 Tax=Pseudocercospora fijiensis (strain CIRAD86) TaxID=383855 RepID=M3ANX0_PSEFD|nr:uncharacterized protein MYCFIDRAFT_181915 [Pseudocercospora fijiensis CIRAD86]EME86271.1 hypothetical protein MYCFIDRAFT_181915 [Pseudocercospora fijiensis CIRAD86]